MKTAVRTQQLTVALAVLATFMAGACSKMDSSSPYAPSPLTTPSAPSSSGATITGRVNAGGVTVSVVGSSLSASVDDRGLFRLDNVAAGEIELQFSGNGVSVRVGIGRVAEGERFDVRISLSGGSGTVEASEHVTPDDHAEVEGRIVSIDSAARSIVVGSSTVRVPGDAGIQSRGASLRFEDLRVQQRVEVSGMKQGGVVTATLVRVEDDDAPGPAPRAEVEFTGSVSSVSGPCGGRTLVVGGTTVKTDSSTEFVKVACSDLSTGMKVQVKGTVQADGLTVLASRIKAEDAGAPAPEPEIP